MNVDPAFGNWLAGFIDGEGCFSINFRGRPNQERYYCQFKLTLRADDRDILEEIQRQTGFGSLYDQTRQGDDSRERKPQVDWSVHRGGDCLQLAAILDAHPLRAKKRRDYLIWREALSEQMKGPTNDQTRMAALDLALRAVRAFSGAETEVAVPESPQLRLVG